MPAQVIDLTNLAASDGFIIQGDAADDNAGYSVSNAGDINGDGIDDLIVGAWRGDDGGYSAGEAYVIYGKSGSTRGTLDLTNLAASDGFVIQGDAAGDFAGISVSSAGDLNGDGIDDLIIGAYGGDDGGYRAGEAYVIYGKVGSTRATVDLTNLAAGDGFIIQGDAAGDNAGWSVSSAGDVNGDGIDDLTVGARNGDDGGINAGEAYVIYGKLGNTRGRLDLTNLATIDGFIIQGDTAEDQAGWSLSGAGDVNGDGIDDLIVGAPNGDDGGSNAGEAYVIYGKLGNTRGRLDLTGLAGGDGFIIQGDAAGDQVGISVSGAGDVNGDGIDDLIVGAHFGDDGGSNAGEAYVIYGKLDSTRGRLDLTGLAAIDGFIIQGDTDRDYAGRSVSGAGDVNGDGIDDLIVGAWGGDDGGGNAGEAYVIYGKSGSTRGALDLTNLAAGDGFIIQGDAAGDEAGISVSSAGDVNSDGIHDLIVGAWGGDDGGNNAGEAYVIYGSRLIGTITGTEIDDILIGTARNDVINALAGDDLLDGSMGADLMRGGGGNDTYVVDHAGDVVIESPDEGIDTVESSYDLFILPDNVENLTLIGAAFLGFGNALDNIIIGSADYNVLNGGEGDDLLRGGDNGNELDGGDGNDVMQGGAGQDTYYVDSVGDRVVETVGLALDDTVDAGGVDFVYATNTSYSLAGGGGGQFVEVLVLLGDGDASATGNALNNALEGNIGNNILDGGAGNDFLTGRTGDDVYFIDTELDSIAEEFNEGTDTVFSTVSYLLAANVENLELQGEDDLNGFGNELSNSITGNAGNNRLDGFAGADVLAGGLGNDIYVIDSVGDVVIEAMDAGIDLVEAALSYALTDNVENLSLTGAGHIDGTGNAIGNRIIGNGGNNVLNGAAGADVLQGFGGNDSYVVDNASDRVVETLSLTVGDTNDAGGVDTVFASVGYSLDTASNIRFVENLTLTGAANINAIGNALANALTGNSGNNTLDGGAGNDAMAGGAGNDIYLVDAAGDVVTEGASAGTDTVRASVNHTLSANVENLQLQGTANINGIGNGENNAITGTSGNNRLEGLGGNDAIDGGLGADTMLGGAGNDSYIIDNGNDRVFETLTNNAADTNDAGGTDTVSTSITINMNGYNGIRFVERAVLTGTASIGITGNALANHITGNNGNNTIDGGEGADTMIGGRGNDIYTVDKAGDVVTEVVGQGFDTVRASIDYTLGSEVEDLVLTGSANLTGTGNGLANRLTGNSGNNILDGGGGTDTLIGGAGNDTYIFDSAGDRAVETVTATVTDTNDAGGIDQILSGFTVNLAQSNGMRFIENVTLTGTAAAAVYGNDLANSITANSGANYLDGANGDDSIFGMGGNDTMLGRAGNDTLDGGAGRDRLTGGAGQDILTGGSEADTFVFATGDMGTSQATADRITDWSGLGAQGDRIDLSAIDANSANGSGTNEAFAFIGSGAFTNVAGQLRSEVIGGNTYLMADTNGDGVADLLLRLDGAVAVGAGDFSL